MNLFGTMEFGTHQQSYPRVLIHPCLRKLHATLDRALLLFNSLLFGFTTLIALENTKTHDLVMKLDKGDAHLQVNNMYF